MTAPARTSFKNLLRNKYGQSITTATTAYQRCVEKSARFRNHVAFTMKCKKEGIVPKSLYIRPPIDTERGRRITQNAERQLLNERLRVSNFQIRKLEEERKWREIGLRRKLDSEDFERLLKMSRDNAELTFVNTRERQQQKFERLRLEKSKRDTQQTSTGQDRWVVNLSSRNLSEHEVRVLKKGLNFAPTPTNIAKKDIIAGVETALRQHKHLDDNRAEGIRAAVASVVRRAKTPKQNLSKEERQALRSLKQNDEIIVLPADKGNSTVVMNAKDYETKATDLLTKHPFEQIDRDPLTTRNEQRVNNTLKALADAGKIDNSTLKSLRVSSKGTRSPLLYGAAKLHKPNCPLRPIVSTIGSATYKVAREVKGEVRTKNDRNICEIKSCMKNNGKSPTFKFVSGEERRPSEVQGVSRDWRLPGATHSSADLTWIRK